MRKLFILVLLMLGIACANATPIKNMWVTLETSATGAGTVYISSTDPNPKMPSVEGEQAEIQCTVTEANGAYPVTLHATPKAGWTLLGFTNVLRSDGNYQNTDFVSKSNPAQVSVLIPRSTNTSVGVGVSNEELESKRNEARNNEVWPDVPDAKFYAVFIEDTGKNQLSGLTRYADFQQPDGSGSLGVIVQPEIIYEGEEVTVVATPNPGCSFVKWTDKAGNTVSTSASLIFVATKDVVYTAYFEQSPINFLDVNGLVSFSGTKAVKVDVSETMKAFIITGVTDNTAITKAVNFIPHGAGVLLTYESGLQYSLNTNVRAADESLFLTNVYPSFNNDNKLVGTGANAVETDGTFYVLADKSRGIGLYRLKRGQKVPEGKAYIIMPEGYAYDFIPIEGFPYSDINVYSTETGIASPEADNRSDSYGCFNLAGQRVTEVYNGIVIKNGKKVVR